MYEEKYLRAMCLSIFGMGSYSKTIFSKGIDNYYYEATSKASQIKRSFDKNSFAAYSIFCGQDG
jgi:hypothetical protein